MPIYDFSCNKCQHTFSKLLKMDDRMNPCVEPCPECKAEETVDFCIGAPSFTDSFKLGRIKPDQDFRDLLKIVEKSAGSLANIKSSHI